MAKAKRNLTVELWRIIFCLVILCFHFFTKFEMKPFHAGYLGVEFFFLLSGLGLYNTYAGYADGKKTSAITFLISFIKKRIIRLYPLYLLSMLCMLCVRLAVHQLALPDLFTYLKDCLAEFFMLQCSPLGREVMIAANWYVAVLLWGSLLWMVLLLALGKKTVYIVAPLTTLGLYGYYFFTIGKILSMTFCSPFTELTIAFPLQTLSPASMVSG